VSAFRILIAALFLGGAVPVMAASAAPATAPAAQDDAARLVGELIAEGPLADLAVRSFDHSVESSGDAEAKARYARYPGLREAVAAKLRPELLKILRRALPDLRSQVRAILVADLTPDELREAADFFASPTGRKVYASALKSIGDRPDRSEKEAGEAAAAAVMRDLAPRDYGPLMKFSASGAGRKMNRINPKIAAASKSWANALVAKNEKKMRGLAKRAPDKYVAKARRGKRK
jgi:hypothetical protein